MTGIITDSIMTVVEVLLSHMEMNAVIPMTVSNNFVGEFPDVPYRELTKRRFSCSCSIPREITNPPR